MSDHVFVHDRKFWASGLNTQRPKQLAAPEHINLRSLASSVVCPTALKEFQIERQLWINIEALRTLLGRRAYAF
jgi:hypothetical protein